MRGRLPREQWPVTRTYTVRHWDPIREELTIDFVMHAKAGVAASWAARAQPGDRLQLQGPGGAYAPDPAVDWHLLAGDESVLPAIAMALERIQPARPVRVVVQVTAATERQTLQSDGELDVRWISASDPEDGSEPLADALAALTFPPGRFDAFIHGEATAVRAMRRHLLVEREIQPDALSASGYWKRRRTEDGWREDKADWSRLTDADLASKYSQ